MFSNHQNRFDTRSSVMIDDAGLRTPGRYLREVRVKEGQTLYHQGDPASLLYEIVQGVARLERVLPNGRRQVMSFAFATDIVGFPHDGFHRSACKMITPGSVVSHHSGALERTAADSGLRRRLFNAAMAEIGVLHDHFLMLGGSSAIGRTAGFLVQLMERIGVREGHQTIVHLPMCRTDIADYLGLSTETISRMISQLRAERLISLPDAQTIVVLDPDRLSRLADGE